MNDAKKIRCLVLATLLVLTLGVSVRTLDPNRPASSFLRTHYTTDDGLPGDDITPHWLTNTGTSSARPYWEDNNNTFNSVKQKMAEISIPVAVTVFPGEIYAAPRSWTERAYPKLIHYNRLPKGTHFAAWEQPELFTAELSAAFKTLR